MNKSVELVYMDAKSSKFWRIELNGPSHTVTYGRLGTEGQSSQKSFPSEEKAEADMDKLIKSKKAKGYNEASAAGVDATGESADGTIPLMAFSSITKKEDIYSNASTFMGLRVSDYNPKSKAKSDVAYRFRTDYDDEEGIIPKLEHFLATDAAKASAAIVIGAWQGDDSEMGSEKIIQVLCENKDKLPNLKGIYVGDITQEENEISWIEQTDVSTLLTAFPKLEFLRVRGGNGLELKTPNHATLRALTIETGGMDVSVIRSLGMSKFPELEHLELWLGTDDYGCNITTADLQPLFNGAIFPKLKYIGFRNAHFADAIAGVIVNSPLMERVTTIDLSLGTLSEEGAQALLTIPPTVPLKRLQLHHHFIPAPIQKKLKAMPFTVDLTNPADMDEDEDRFVAIGE